MHELTDERLAEMRRIAEETRPEGGWTADGYQVHDEDGHQVYGADAYGDGTSPAAEHIAAFDPPTVLALLDRLDAVLKLHHAVDCEPSETICAGCSTLRGAGSSARYFPYTEHPCPTVLAARGER